MEIRDNQSIAADIRIVATAIVRANYFYNRWMKKLGGRPIHVPPPHISMVVSQKVGVSSLARPNRSLHLRREPSPYQNSLFERQNSPFFAILSPVAETSIAQPHQHPFLPPPAPISHRNFSHRPLRRSPDCWEGREWGGVGWGGEELK